MLRAGMQHCGIVRSNLILAFVLGVFSAQRGDAMVAKSENPHCAENHWRNSPPVTQMQHPEIT
jgi:hypothetical protein